MNVTDETSAFACRLYHYVALIRSGTMGAEKTWAQTEKGWKWHGVRYGKDGVGLFVDWRAGPDHRYIG